MVVVSGASALEIRGVFEVFLQHSAVLHQLLPLQVVGVGDQKVRGLEIDPAVKIFPYSTDNHSSDRLGDLLEIVALSQ